MSNLTLNDIAYRVAKHGRISRDEPRQEELDLIVANIRQLVAQEAAAPAEVTDEAIIAAARAMQAQCDGVDRWQRLSESVLAQWVESVRPIAAALASPSAGAVVPDGEVILEHSGCGHGAQANQLWVSLHPGDKVLMVRGRQGKPMLAAAPEVPRG